MPEIPYIVDRNREVQNFNKAQAFRKLVKSRPQTVLYLKYSGTNASTAAAFGDAIPNFNAGVAVDALYEEPTKMEQIRAWGTDTRINPRLFVLASDADTWGLTSKDRFSVNGVVYEIFEIHYQLGQGHEKFAYKVELAKQGQTPT